MYCQLHTALTSDPTCTSTTRYDEVSNLLTFLWFFNNKFFYFFKITFVFNLFEKVRAGVKCTNEPICVNELCHTCTDSGWTKELNCRHGGTAITPVKENIASYELCRDACIAEATCELFVYHTADTTDSDRKAQAQGSNLTRTKLFYHL